MNMIILPENGSVCTRSLLLLKNIVPAKNLYSIGQCYEHLGKPRSFSIRKAVLPRRDESPPAARKGKQPIGGAATSVGGCVRLLPRPDPDVLHSSPEFPPLPFIRSAAPGTATEISALRFFNENRCPVPPDHATAPRIGSQIENELPGEKACLLIAIFLVFHTDIIEADGEKSASFPPRQKRMCGAGL